jgi:hypothetical protein
MAPLGYRTRAGPPAATRIRSQAGFSPVPFTGLSRGAPAGRITARIAPAFILASIRAAAGAGSGIGGAGSSTAVGGPGSIERVGKTG